MFLEIINLVSNIMFESELDFSFLLVLFDVPHICPRRGGKKKHASLCIVIVSNNEFGGVSNIVEHHLSTDAHHNNLIFDVI